MTFMNYIAHIRSNDLKEQTIAAHCEHTAILAYKYADKLNLKQTAWLAGALHDIGKFTNDFNRYIHGDTTFHRGSLDHSFAGAKYINEIAHLSEDKMVKKTASLIGRIIISHHNLNDWVSVKGDDTYQTRIDKEKYYAEIRNNMSELYPMTDAEHILEQAASEIRKIRTAIKQLAGVSKEAFAFYLGMLERLMQSILIDADRTDTANFMSDSETEAHFDTQALWQEMQNRIQHKLDTFSSYSDPISLRRRDISDRCAAFARQEVHICKLIVPTGGGKTLSSLRFATQYAANHQKDKIIYVAPFMSILEQNSDVIREISGENAFLEHHSNILAEVSESNDTLHEYELRSEKWDSPVIATTMVQFLNTLFSGKSSSVRRMHRLTNAVIIVDEVQSIPLKCVYLFNLAINFLAHICGSTIVLCSATQPRLEMLADFPLLLDENNSMTGDTTEDFKAFRRTELFYQIQIGGFSYEEAAEFCLEKFRSHGSLLCIVNTKAAAKALYQKLRNTSDAFVFHLSTNMCPQHRRNCICDMKKRLVSHEPVICITTQLIEAGVDISFGCVVRSLAGMDNAAQAAGRCNRNGEYGKICPVYILELWEEKLGNLKEISSAQKISRQLFDTAKYTDFLSPSMQSDYFDKLYLNDRSQLRYPVNEPSFHDIINLLSLNKDLVKYSGNKELQFCGQAFKTAGQLFQVIESHTTDVIVPYQEEAQKLIAQLESEQNPHEVMILLRQAQKYYVSIYSGTEHLLGSESALRILSCGAVVLDKRFYDPEYGVITEGSAHEVLLY